MRHVPVALALAVALVSAAIVSACAINKESMKEFFAPDFSSIDDTLLQDGMWRLGQGVQQLDDTFKADGLDDETRHTRIMEILDVMEAAAASVKEPGARQGHTNVSMNIDQLIVDISAAKTAAAANEYEPAKALPVACLACHQGGGGGAQQP